MTTPELLTQAAQKCAKEISHCRCDKCVDRKSEIILSTLQAVTAELVKENESLRSKVQRQEDGPSIICLCGSTRFWKNFQEINLRETRAGKIVLSIGAATGSDTEHLASGAITAEDKQRFDELHKRKIDLSDEVLILNYEGYIGESTRSEIEYATKLSKPIRYIFEAAMQQDKPEKE